MLQLLKVINILITNTMRTIISSLYYQLHNLKVWSTITT